MQEIDIEDILNYQPQKIEIIDTMSGNYSGLLFGIKRSQNWNSNGWYVKKDSNFYWILNEVKKVPFFKLYGDEEYLNDVLTSSPIEREVSYFYLHIKGSTKRVISIHGGRHIEDIFQHFKDKIKEEVFEGKAIYKICDRLYLYKNPHFAGSCLIFPDIESLAFYEGDNFKGDSIPKLNESVVNFKSNIDLLNEKLDCAINFQMITQQDLNTVAAKCFKYSKTNDLYELYPALCSLLVKYLEDNGYGKVQLINEDNGINPMVKKGSIEHDVILSVLKTIDNMNSFEFNPLLYFNI